jgi:hypothetical protein
MSDLMLDVSQAAELKMAFRRSNWTNEKIKRLSEGDMLARVLEVIEGRAEIKMIEHWIDCDAQPFIPDGWKVEEHRSGGQWKFNPQKISLYLSKKQNKGTVCGNDLRQELADKPVLNANVLGFLLAHTELIPEEWKGKFIFFWGTIYRDAVGRLYVRYFGWDGSQWSWNYNNLDHVLGTDNPAALAS